MTDEPESRLIDEGKPTYWQDLWSAVEDYIQHKPWCRCGTDDYCDCGLSASLIRWNFRPDEPVWEGRR